MKAHSFSLRYFKLPLLMDLMYFYHVPCILSYGLNSSTNIVLTIVNLMLYYRKRSPFKVKWLCTRGKAFPKLRIPLISPFKPSSKPPTWISEHRLSRTLAVPI